MVVIDTNIIISALHSSKGVSNLFLLHCLNKNIEYSVTPLIFLEYIGVIEEKIKMKEIAISRNIVKPILSKLLENAIAVYDTISNRPILPDSSDDKFLECAIASSAKNIITYNVKHFPNDILYDYGVQAIMPKAFLKKENLL